MSTSVAPDVVVDTSKTLCPVPVIRARQAMDQLQAGQVMKLIATDPGAKNDIPSFARTGGHQLLGSSQEGKQLVFLLKKGGK